MQTSCQPEKLWYNIFEKISKNFFADCQNLYQNGQDKIFSARYNVITGKEMWL